MDKFCSNCGKELNEGADVCLECGKSLNHQLKKKKSVLHIIIIVAIIILFLLFAISYYGNQITISENNQIELDKKAIQTDAINMLIDATLQKNDTIKCLVIHGYEGVYQNSGNYIGSIDVSENEDYIWLSDGNYLLKGTIDDLIIVESNLTATDNCSVY